MSWNNNKRYVWGYITFFALYILLHGVFEVGYLREQLSVQKKRMDNQEGWITSIMIELSKARSKAQKCSEKFAEHEEEYKNHTHRYYDGKIK